jgi:hypothetical protein
VNRRPTDVETGTFAQKGAFYAPAVLQIGQPGESFVSLRLCECETIPDHDVSGRARMRTGSLLRQAPAPGSSTPLKPWILSR